MKIIVIRRVFRLYGVLVRAGWAKALEYRAQAFLWILTSVFPLVMMMVWLAVVAEAGPITGWGEREFISYYVAAAVVYQLTFSWSIWNWDEDIRTGNLSVKLLKPVDPFHHFVSEQLGWKLFILVFLVPVVALIAWATPAIDYPITAARLALSGAAVAAGYLVALMMSTSFGMIAFWSTQSSNLYSLWWGTGSFLSGWIAPLALFPEPFRRLASWLPFRSVLSFPIEILLGKAAGMEVAFGFAVTGGWTLLFYLAYRFLWQRGLKRYEAVGA